MDLLDILSDPEEYKSKLLELKSLIQQSEDFSRTYLIQKQELDNLRQKTEADLSTMKEIQRNLTGQKNSVQAKLEELKSKEDTFLKRENELQARYDELHRKQELFAGERHNAEQQLKLANTIRQDAMSMKEEFSHKLAKLKAIIG